MKFICTNTKLIAATPHGQLQTDISENQLKMDPLNKAPNVLEDTSYIPQTSDPQFGNSTNWQPSF